MNSKVIREEKNVALAFLPRTQHVQKQQNETFLTFLFQSKSRLPKRLTKEAAVVWT
jgi:hypothetical protein